MTQSTIHVFASSRRPRIQCSDPTLQLCTNSAKLPLLPLLNSSGIPETSIHFLHCHVTSSLDGCPLSDKSHAITVSESLGLRKGSDAGEPVICEQDDTATLVFERADRDSAFEDAALAFLVSVEVWIHFPSLSPEAYNSKLPVHH